MQEKERKETRKRGNNLINIKYSVSYLMEVITSVSWLYVSTYLGFVMCNFLNNDALNDNVKGFSGDKSTKNNHLTLQLSSTSWSCVLSFCSSLLHNFTVGFLSQLSQRQCWSQHAAVFIDKALKLHLYFTWSATNSRLMSVHTVEL